MSVTDILNGTGSEQEEFPLLMPRWGYVASAFVLFLIGFFGFFLNLMVILLMFKDRQLWTPLNIILFNLVCSDFSVSVLGNPFTLISALFHRWIFGRSMCVLYGFFMALLGITSITTLTVISFERYLMVTRPLSSRHLTCRGAVLSVLFIWTYSLALTTPPLMGWGNYVNEAANISCSVNWHEQSRNALSYILFLFAMGQIVPFVVITFSYVNIIRTMKRNSQRLGRVSRAEARATNMVFIMIISFTVAWTPYSVFALMEQFATEGIISPGVGVIPALVAKSSICYDPLIYVGMNTQFRQSIKRIFGIHKSGINGRNLQTDRRYNVTITSPAHRLTSFNDIIKQNSESFSNKRDKKIIITDETSDIYNEMQRKLKNIELCTIQEVKTGSDAEKSGDTIYDEDSSNSHTKKQTEGKLFNENSPILTIVDSERTIFVKTKQRENETTDLLNIYGNDAFEDHVTDTTDFKTEELKPKIRQSYSLDFTGTPRDHSQRKLSIESKLETVTQSKGLVENVINFFEHGAKPGQDSFKSYLFRFNNDNEGDNL